MTVESGDENPNTDQMSVEGADCQALFSAEPLSLDIRWPDQERVSWRILLYILAVLAVGVSAVFARPEGWQIALFVVAPWPLAEFLVRLGMVYTRRAFMRTSWRLTADLLEIRRGVWWRSVVTVPLSRVQHTDVNQGPLQRRFDLSTLVVHTAGTRHATVKLEGLGKKIAESVRDELLKQRGDDAV